MIESDKRRKLKLLLKLFVYLFDKAVSSVDSVHNLIKYGLITKNSRIYKLFMNNKSLLKIWVIARVLDLIQSLKQITKLNLLYKEYVNRANKLNRTSLLSKNKQLLIEKNLHELEYNIKQWKRKYIAALWDLIDSILTLALSILKIWKTINASTVQKVEKLNQSLGYLRISYDMYNMSDVIRDVYSVMKTRRG